MPNVASQNHLRKNSRKNEGQLVHSIFISYPRTLNSSNKIWDLNSSNKIRDLN